MDWATLGTGAFCGFLLADILWRVTYGLTMKLVEEQRAYISELRAVLGAAA